MVPPQKEDGTYHNSWKRQFHKKYTCRIYRHSKSFEIHIDQLHLSYACENSFISKMPGELACKRKDEIIFEFKTSLRPA